MESRRKTEHRLIRTQLHELEWYVDTNERAIGRLRGNPSSSAIVDQIQKLQNSLLQHRDEIDRLRSRQKSLDAGDLDAELASKSAQIHTKNDHREVRQQHAETLRIEKKSRTTFTGPSTRPRHTERDFQSGYRYFRKCCDSIPDKTRQNLREMPNNKGYIWRGVYLFGQLPAERGQPTVLFEKQGRDVLLIHEYTPTEYARYEKVGQQKKRLVSRYATKPIPWGNSGQIQF
jgi:hypothetical protein